MDLFNQTTSLNHQLKLNYFNKILLPIQVKIQLILYLFFKYRTIYTFLEYN